MGKPVGNLENHGKPMVLMCLVRKITLLCRCLWVFVCLFLNVCIVMYSDMLLVSAGFYGFVTVRYSCFWLMLNMIDTDVYYTWILVDNCEGWFILVGSDDTLLKYSLNVRCG